MRKTTIMSVLVLWATSLVVAQGPPAPPDPATRVQHQLHFLNTLLSLTEAQQQQAATLFTTAATSESTLHEQMRSAHKSLAGAVKSNNSTGIEQAAAAIGNLTTQLTSIQAKAKAAFYQILTPDQQAKLSQLEGAGRRGFGGPAGPVGPPPMD